MCKIKIRFYQPVLHQMWDGKTGLLNYRFYIWHDHCCFHDNSFVISKDRQDSFFIVFQEFYLRDIYIIMFHPNYRNTSLEVVCIYFWIYYQYGVCLLHIFLIIRIICMWLIKYIVMYLWHWIMLFCVRSAKIEINLKTTFFRQDIWHTESIFIRL